MSCRGLFNLKKINFFYCDMSGSSIGARELLVSKKFKDFYLNNKDTFEFNFYIRRSHHPYLSALYLNGFIKDIPLLNKSYEDILSDFLKVKNSLGRKSLNHNSKKVFSFKPSIQGKWRENMWNQHPYGEIEKQKELPKYILRPELYDSNEKRTKKIIKKDIVRNIQKKELSDITLSTQ